ncbi:MAG: penicillin-binding protein activator [Nocardiopsaceae bacterium]|nr:penicillin-binding protein activator [Nocardiopsaceae bacterium]
MRKRFAMLGGCAAAAVVALAACTAPGSGSGAHSPVKVGYLLPLTGVYTSNGTTEEEGFKLGLKTFGNSVDGHPIQVTYLNTQGEPSLALSAATQLVARDKVQLVEGPLISSESTVVAPYVLGQGTMEDDLYLASPTQMAAYEKNHMGFTSDWDGYQPTTEGASWAYNTMHWRHVTVVGLNISYGWQGVGGFEAEFKKLGGTVDKSIWVPSDAVEMSSYVSSIPRNTQAVFVVLSGSQAANFVNSYAQFGLKSKVPLMGITTLTDQAALPAEHAAAALGVYTASQYCDDLPGAVNKKFADSFRAAYGTYPSYYSEAGYTKAEILVKALESLHGQVTSEAALAKAMDQVKVTAPRGPVTISPVTHSPVENQYICKVENVDGVLRNVPILTYPSVQPWGTLPESVFQSAFAAQSSGPPS